MSVTPLEFFTSAQAILDRDSCEIASRNAISRSYYAAHLQSRDIVGQFCPDPNGHLVMGAHERVVDWIKACTAIANNRAMAIMLHNLKVARRKADYELGPTINRLDAETHLKTVERFLAHLNAASAGSAASA